MEHSAHLSVRLFWLGLLLIAFSTPALAQDRIPNAYFTALIGDIQDIKAKFQGNDGEFLVRSLILDASQGKILDQLLLPLYKTALEAKAATGGGTRIFDFVAQSSETLRAYFAQEGMSVAEKHERLDRYFEALLWGANRMQKLFGYDA